MSRRKPNSSQLATVNRNGGPDGRPIAKRRLDFGKRWSYAPALEANSYIKLRNRYQLFINGRFVSPKSGQYFDSINPATEEKLAEIGSANKGDVDLAVKAARRSYKNVWSKMPGRERGKYLFRIARLIQEKARELAVLETMDGGKTIKESRNIDLPLVAAHFFYYAGWADKLEYAFPGRKARPLGVAGQIIPWNFPLLMAAWKLAPALACGNTCVLKPAETTSITALHLAEIFQEAGLPDGVVNIVTGPGETGSALVNHPDINKIAFTGSTEVGKRIASVTVGMKKKLTIEITTMIRNRHHAIAAAYPNLNCVVPNDFSYRYIEIVWYWRAEPPIAPFLTGWKRKGSVKSWSPPIVETTTVKMILGLLYPTKGHIEVFGHSPRHVATKPRIGYLPEESYLYCYLNSRETLDFFGKNLKT